MYTKWKMLVSGTRVCSNGVLCALCATVGSNSLRIEFNLAPWEHRPVFRPSPITCLGVGFEHIQYFQSVQKCDVLFYTVLLTAWRKVLKMAVVAQVLKFDTGPRAGYVFSNVIGLPYALCTHKAFRFANKLNAHRFSSRSKRPTKRTRQLRLVLVNILETRTLKFAGGSTKPRTTTRLVLRESQITYGLVASFF